jgi:hypothetical protein
MRTLAPCLFACLVGTTGLARADAQNGANEVATAFAEAFEQRDAKGLAALYARGAVVERAGVFSLSKPGQIDALHRRVFEACKIQPEVVAVHEQAIVVTSTYACHYGEEKQTVQVGQVLDLGGSGQIEHERVLLAVVATRPLEIEPRAQLADKPVDAACRKSIGRVVDELSAAARVDGHQRVAVDPVVWRTEGFAVWFEGHGASEELRVLGDCDYRKLQIYVPKVWRKFDPYATPMMAKKR